MKPSEPFDLPSAPTATLTRRDVLRVAGAAAIAASCPALLSRPVRAQAAVKRIRLAHPAPTAHGWHIWAEQFKKTIEDKRGGKNPDQIFATAQIGQQPDTAQADRIRSHQSDARTAG